jgi:hypothetical protein
MRRTSGGLVVVLGIVGLALGLAPAQAMVVCKMRSGTMVAREACKSKETAIDLAQFGPAGPQGGAGAVGAAGYGAVLKDATGNFVGTLLDEPALFPSTATRTLRTIEGHVVSFAVDPGTGFVDAGATFAAIYEHPGCTGRLFLAPLLPTLPMFAQALVHDGIAFYPVDVPTVHNFTSVLTFTTMGLCGGTWTPPDQCCTPSFSSGLLSEGRTFAVNTLGVVAPFHADLP